MNRWHFPVLLAAVTICASILIAPATADDDDKDADGVLPQVMRIMAGVKVELADAVKTAEGKTGGRAVAAKLDLEDGKPAFEVFVLVTHPQAQLLEVVIDARTGAILEVEVEAAEGSRAHEDDNSEDDDSEDDDSEDDDSEDDDSEDDDSEDDD